MARWDIFERQTRREVELPPQSDVRRQPQEGTGVSVGRGPSDSATGNQSEKPERPRPDSQERSPRRDARKVERDSGYRLRPREIRAMTDIGTFRTLDAQDLARFVYGGDARAMNYDLGELRT